VVHVDEYTVGEVAHLSHISVRTLHHYDGIGLLTPSGRSAAGYRLYSDADLRRLQRILFYRELEFGLDETAEMLADPDAGAGDHLRRQHRLLRQRQSRDQALLGARSRRRWRHISRWFYNCGYDMHRGLAQMFVADSRYTESYDKIAPGSPATSTTRSSPTPTAPSPAADPCS